MLRMPRLIWLLILLVMLSASGCTPEETFLPVEYTDPTAWPSPTVTGTPTPTTTPAPTYTPRPGPTRTPTPSMPLSSAGPWLVFSVTDETDATRTGLWAVNADGTGLTQITTESALSSFADPQAVSPRGDRLAVIAPVALDGAEGLSLNTIRLPGGQVEVLAELTPQAGTAAAEADSATINAALQVAEQQPVSWSPTGDHIAFVSVREGTSTDVYVYNRFARAVVHLTDEPGHAVWPSWSPGGNYVAYGVIDDPARAASPLADSIWVAWTGGVGGRQLYDPQPGGEAIVGWLDGETLLTSGWRDDCGGVRLRSVNVVSGERRVLWDDAFRAVAFDPANGVILLAAGSVEPGCEAPGEASGLVFVLPGSVQQALPDGIAGGPVQRIEWSTTQGVFRVWVGPAGEPATRLLTVTPEGQVRPLTIGAGVQPVLSPDGAMAAWVSTDSAASVGLWIGPADGLPEPALEGGVSAVSWAPSGANLFVFRRSGSDETGVYVGARPGYRPIPLLTGVLPGRYVWMAGSP